MQGSIERAEKWTRVERVLPEEHPLAEMVNLSRSRFIPRGPKRRVQSGDETAGFYAVIDFLPAINGEDSYGRGGVFSSACFGGFLLHRSALLRRISTGFTSGLPGPRSMFQNTENL
jgi:hypothetical protein